jgi:hypothetical protein
MIEALVICRVRRVDDYGHWQGARRAIDEYLREQQEHYLMLRLDYTGRLLIKN